MSNNQGIDLFELFIAIALVIGLSAVLLKFAFIAFHWAVR